MSAGNVYNYWFADLDVRGKYKSYVTVKGIVNLVGLTK